MEARRVVVVTGAGASHNLGLGGNLPLMQGWVKLLRADIDQDVSGASDLIGLTEDLDGESFERTLGKFLGFRSDFDAIWRLVQLGSARQALEQNSYMQALRQQARSSADVVVRAIHRNLYKTFGEDQFDVTSAVRAYSRLHTWLSPVGQRQMAYATTNYDTSLELALYEMNYRVLDGFDENPRRSSFLDASGMVRQAEDDPRSVPVIHLHGAVGWYTNSAGSIKRHHSDLGVQEQYGDPALLLPDSRKTVNSLIGAESLWESFHQFLRQAHCIVVLGHSLHDEHLIDLMRPFGPRTAVLWYASSENFGKPNAIKQASEYVHFKLPGASAVLCDFGPGGTVDQEALNNWIERLPK